MSLTRTFRAMQLSLDMSTVDHGIEYQTLRTRLGRTCKSGNARFQAKCIQFEINALFERENQMEREAWSAKQEEREDRKLALEAHRRFKAVRSALDFEELDL